MTVPYKKESHRKGKVEGLIKQEISRIILHEISDPRCGFCTVTGVNLSADLRTANIFVSVLGEEAEQRTTMRALEHAHGFIQKRLFQELKLRYAPSIKFHLDNSIERSIRISQILREEGVPDTSDGFGETGHTEVAESGESREEGRAAADTRQDTDVSPVRRPTNPGAEDS